MPADAGSATLTAQHAPASGAPHGDGQARLHAVRIGAQLARSMGAATLRHTPYRFWQLQDVLPPPDLAALRALTPAQAKPVDTAGRRETHNATRIFFNTALQQRSAAAAALARYLQSTAARDLWCRHAGVDLAGSFLRIEYCQDMAGFWLEPHTDIGAKYFTLLIYLADPPPGECWGTDIFDARHNLVLRASGAANTGVLFIPAADTWHGFGPRPISGVRRTLIVNYVTHAWRARHELCFPDTALA